MLVILKCCLDVNGHFWMVIITKLQETRKTSGQNAILLYSIKLISHQFITVALNPIYTAEQKQLDKDE